MKLTDGMEINKNTVESLGWKKEECKLYHNNMIIYTSSDNNWIVVLYPDEESAILQRMDD